MIADNCEESNSTPLRIGDWTYHPDLLKLERGPDTIKLEPRVGQLLVFLSQQAGHPVSRDELLAAVWPNRVVGDEALSNAINKLRKAVGDDRQNPSYLETIPKVGYRLIAPVETLSIATADSEPRSGPGKSTNRAWTIGAAATGLLLLLVLAIALPWTAGDRPAIEQTDKQGPPASLEAPRLLILPFADLSDDHSQGYLADGIVEDMITDLSRIDHVRVLARSTSFQYQGKQVDPQQIASKLGVSHLVEGSVRKLGDTLRITARLIDTGTAQNVWSQRYDRSLSEIFEVQEDLTQKIVDALTARLAAKRSARVSLPGNSFEVYDLYLKGRQALSQRTPEANKRAQDYYRQAILLDPNFSRAYGGIAAALTRYANKGWSDTPQVERDLALHYAQKAVELDPDSPDAYWSLGFTRLYRHENALAAEAVEKALQLAPGYADGMSLLAQIYNYSAQAEKAIALIEEAILINPLYSWDYLFNLGWAHYTLGDYEKAVKYQQMALARNPYATYARLMLVAGLMALHREEEAQWQVDEVLAYHTNMSIRFLQQETPIEPSNARTRQFLAHLQAAGIPLD
ncbi:MAG: winged helix-turn-helix domain-containing protein [Gammaproteobacteria bacterium]|nr:winged helix-turn-helix domain-containing protein [Gammaproteobacteria bacterium]